MKKEILESYKGVRDFYPEDQFVLDYIKETMSRVCESFGFEKYHASVLEPAELYESKTSEEIVNEQTYIFEDRGGRKVVLRPEMTPTVARMVAKRRRELGFPLRLYSIPNVFRYERPQKGRLREHWQLNADIFGADNELYELELLQLAHGIMLEFGAKEEDFVIKINSREVLESIFDELEIPPLARKSTLRLLDRKDKISKEEFEESLLAILANKSEEFKEKLNASASAGKLSEIKDKLANLGVKNVKIDSGIVRGFDYYTGLVFEVYDTNPDNPRALFGGGRYDRLMEALGQEPIKTVGFGMGDVSLSEFLKLRGLLPEYKATTELAILLLDKDESVIQKAFDLSAKLRRQDINVAVNFSFAKLDKQIKNSKKLHIPFALLLGKKELESGLYSLKDLQSGASLKLQEDEIANYIFESDINDSDLT